MRLNLFRGLLVALTLTLPGLSARVWAQAPGTSSVVDRERNKAQARYQFAKNFRELQLNGQKLLKDHKERNLTPRDLAKKSRSINKNARTLRTLMALGNLAGNVEIDQDVTTPEDFDESIRRLARLIWDFAHNPIHQNSKIFNTDQAAEAQTDLMTIINLSKLLGDTARDYEHQDGSSPDRIK